MGLSVTALIVLALLTSSARAAEPPSVACRFQGKAPEGLGRSRSDACRAVLEGLDQDRVWTVPLVITLSYEPPARASVLLTDPEHPHAPITIALSDQSLRRRDFVALGRTIAQLLRAY